ncbi:MAG: peptide chain release factor N(5)-glutamine methyltransferase [Gammaproteobacteria bacterium]|nr:peptide chain release factor N(5)-glutamine methyltransferase [Gammaproteobacteria bacterium]
MPCVADALAAGQATLHLCSETARLDAEVLLAKVTGKSRTQLFAWPNADLPKPALKAYEQLIAQRAAGQPVAYLTGEQEFWSLSLAVNASTLIPRPETERLVELALEYIHMHQATKVLDLGTGSGAIACALMSDRPDINMTITDQSAAALATATRNINRHTNASVSTALGDWFNAVDDEHFDLIISNPPYIAINDPHLTQGDVAAEPRAALISGKDGLDDLRKIIAAAPDHLHRPGGLIVEHGYQQAAAVRQLFQQHQFQNIRSFHDLSGHERVTAGDQP